MAPRSGDDLLFRILYLTRLIQASAVSQAVKAAAMQMALTQLDTSISSAAQAHSDAQALLPELQRQLEKIENQTTFVQQQLQLKEQELAARATSNVRDRNKSPLGRRGSRSFPQL